MSHSRFLRQMGNGSRPSASTNGITLIQMSNVRVQPHRVQQARGDPDAQRQGVGWNAKFGTKF